MRGEAKGEKKMGGGKTRRGKQGEGKKPMGKINKGENINNGEKVIKGKNEN